MPQTLLLIVGIFLLLAGVVVMAALLPEAGLGSDKSFIRRTLILICGIGSLMAIRSVHSLFVSGQAARENFIPLIFSLPLSALIVAAQPLPDYFRASNPVGKNVIINWKPVFLSMSLAAVIFLLQILAP